MDRKALPRGLFQAAVAAADPMRVVPDALPPRSDCVTVIGAGKASARMAEAVESAWGPSRGLVVTRYGHGRPCAGIEIAEAAHLVALRRTASTSPTSARWRRRASPPVCRSAR